MAPKAGNENHWRRTDNSSFDKNGNWLWKCGKKKQHDIFVEPRIAFSINIV